MAPHSERSDRGNDSDQGQGAIVHEAKLCDSIGPAESRHETQGDSPCESEEKECYDRTTPNIEVAVCSSDTVLHSLRPQLLEVVE